MINLEQVLNLINVRKNQALTYAQIGLSEHQFKAFRKVFLDEFGKRGLESDLEQLFDQTQSSISGQEQATGRNRLRKKGGAK